LQRFSRGFRNSVALRIGRFCRPDRFVGDDESDQDDQQSDESAGPRVEPGAPPMTSKAVSGLSRCLLLRPALSGSISFGRSGSWRKRSITV
jgi:hypothetical protein